MTPAGRIDLVLSMDTMQLEFAVARVIVRITAVNRENQ